MSKVIQIRDVSDEVHSSLGQAAESAGMSLTKYLKRELEHLASRTQIVQHNAEVIRRTQNLVHDKPDRDTILSVLHEGRGD